MTRFGRRLTHTAPSTMIASLIVSNHGAICRYSAIMREWGAKTTYSDLQNALLARHLADLFKETIGDIDHLGVNDAILGDRFLERDGDDSVSAQRSHTAKLAAMHHVNRAQAIACGQHTIK